MRNILSNGKMSKVSYPQHLSLTPYQIEQAEDFARSCYDERRKQGKKIFGEQTSDMASNFTFSVYATGLGDVIHIEGFGRLRYLPDGPEDEEEDVQKHMDFCTKTLKGEK